MIPHWIHPHFDYFQVPLEYVEQPWETLENIPSLDVASFEEIVLAAVVAAFQDACLHCMDLDEDPDLEKA